MNSKFLNFAQNKGNPDILTCLADLSSDEVFTPPKIANQMLDMLPESIWSDETATFLDPCSKSGVFLREITKRLNIGLKKKIPDLEMRVNHILKKQVFGIAITKLTSLISRRTLYCSKYANNKELSIVDFDTRNGNLKYIETDHSWKKDRCEACGANKSGYDRNEKLESHAYSFIHVENPAKIFNNMKFDVIIGNPPYQLNDGGGIGTSAGPIYQKFVEQAINLSPKYLIMIIPSRWFSGGKGLDNFRNSILKDKRIKELHDFINADDIFPEIELKGGVCFFLWDKNYIGKSKVKTYRKNKIIFSSKRNLLEPGMTIFVRYDIGIEVLKKIQKFNEQKLIKSISSRKPYGLESNFQKFSKIKDDKHFIKLYRYGEIGYISWSDIPKNAHLASKIKVIISKAGSGSHSFPHQILSPPLISEPNSISTETYIILKEFKDYESAKNLISYVKTKFFRFLVLLKKNTQNASKKVYEFVPVQNFNQSWTDEKLYKKYDLTSKEIAFIESMIKPMN